MAQVSWTFRTVTPETWDDFTALFEGRGGPRPCWCMLWRLDGQGVAAKVGAPERRAAMHDLTHQGAQIGILGYDQGTPVAWCSIAPRSSFGAGLGKGTFPAGLWSLTCFFIRADHRGQGGFAALMAAAEAAAAQNGATQIEAYPVAKDSPSYRFCGFVPSFAAAGYQLQSPLGTRRSIMRKVL